MERNCHNCRAEINDRYYGVGENYCETCAVELSRMLGFMLGADCSFSFDAEGPTVEWNDVLRLIKSCRYRPSEERFVGEIGFTSKQLYDARRKT